MTALTDLPKIGSGKVREIYDLGDQLLLVASDRISTYDVVHPTRIPDKGSVLTGLSTFWFERTSDIVANHFLSVTDGVPDEVRGRGMVVKKLSMLPVECVVRGYLSGSGWKDYQRTGAVCGVRLPAGLKLADRLPEPIFTPATKAAVGEHDENVPFEQVAETLGRELAEQVRRTALAIYGFAADYALRRGIIIADTKFEFGVDEAGTLHLIDEALTPDSSRFWPLDTYREGESPESFDTQYVRNWLDSIGFARKPPAPPMPEAVCRDTARKYEEARRRLMG